MPPRHPSPEYVRLAGSQQGGAPCSVSLRDSGRAEAYTPTERRCKGVGLGRTWPGAPPSFVRPERMP